MLSMALTHHRVALTHHRVALTSVINTQLLEPEGPDVAISFSLRLEMLLL